MSKTFKTTAMVAALCAIGFAMSASAAGFGGGGGGGGGHGSSGGGFSSAGAVGGGSTSNSASPGGGSRPGIVSPAGDGVGGRGEGPNGSTSGAGGRPYPNVWLESMPKAAQPPIAIPTLPSNTTSLPMPTERDLKAAISAREAPRDEAKEDLPPPPPPPAAEMPAPPPPPPAAETQAPPVAEEAPVPDAQRQAGNDGHEVAEALADLRRAVDDIKRDSVKPEAPQHAEMPWGWVIGALFAGTVLARIGKRR